MSRVYPGRNRIGQGAHGTRTSLCVAPFAWPVRCGELRRVRLRHGALEQQHGQPRQQREQRRRTGKAADGDQAELEVGRNCRRVDAWRVVPLDGISRVTVGYGLDARSGALANRYTLPARRLPTDDPTTVALDRWARRTAANRVGREAVIDAPIICDTATAQAVARMQMQVASRPQYLAQLVAAQDDALLPGSLVRVIDTAMAVDVVAQIEGVRYTDGTTCIYDVRAWAGVGKEPA